MHCSSVQGKMQSPLFSAALQNRLTAGSVSMQLHLWRYALQTSVDAVPTVQCCSAKQAHSRQCVTALTPMEICLSYRCAVTQHQCTAALFRAKCSPHCSVRLKQAHSRQCVTALYIYGDLLFTYRCAVAQHKSTAAVMRAKCIPTAQSCYAKHAHSMLVSLQLHLCGHLLFIHVCHGARLVQRLLNPVLVECSMRVRML